MRFSAATLSEQCFLSPSLTSVCSRSYSQYSTCPQFRYRNTYHAHLKLGHIFKTLDGVVRKKIMELLFILGIVVFHQLAAGFVWLILEAATGNLSFRENSESNPLANQYPWKHSLAAAILLALPTVIPLFNSPHPGNYGLLLTMFFWMIVVMGLFSLYYWARFTGTRDLRNFYLAITWTLTAAAGFLLLFMASLASPV